MTDTYELTQLDAHSFEHLVNFLALKVLGKGVTGFAQGPDGGRDGYLTGEAPYPTASERWSGVWYIQSKFHKPHLSKNPQTWLINEVKKELAEFEDSDDRIAPDIWIVATNIEPSGHAATGAYDTIREMVVEAFGDEIKFDIWGGRKILDFLADNPTAASHYGHFLTPGNVLSAMYHQIGDSAAQVKPIINHLILDQFNDQVYTKLEQAGSSGPRPKIHQLFVDLPAVCQALDDEIDIMEVLVSTSANVHRPTTWNAFGENWREWTKVPKRARVLLLKGGPGQGKSTAGQYFSQIQRASLLLEAGAPIVLPQNLEVANELLDAADKLGFRPTNARIPISIELKDFATWYGLRSNNDPKGVLSYLCEKISQKIDQKVEGGTLKRALSLRSWFINFDGLDEVPNDVKDQVAAEIIRLTNVILPELDADVLVLCTTRPQGYSGQFDNLDAVTLELCPLPKDVAIKCAEGVIRFGRTDTESEQSMEVLRAAMESAQVRELMTTPLQSHIMAVVVRDGGRPPEKRWELFDNFYQVMKKRESLKNFPDIRISKLLRENSILLKAIHARLGISLHSRAESSDGAETTLDRKEFCTLARQTTEHYVEENVEDLVETLMEATIERLVFVNTPETSDTVRFDIRQLQEFFAGEFIYSNVDPVRLRTRMEIIGADSHWREVMHFALSALIVTMRPTELTVALEVICGIDDSDQSNYVRTFKRRMGVGAILTLRLLNEGVLEQDRGVRLKFKDAIVPLYAMVDLDVSMAIVSLYHPHTLSWLLNCMIDALFEYIESEQIGAGIVLAKKLPDSHVRCREVSEKIFSSSSEYLNFVYRSFMNDHFSAYGSLDSITKNTWFLKGSMKLLLNSNLDDKLDYPLIVRVLRHTKKSREIATLLELSKTELALLLLVIESVDDSRGHKQNATKLEGMTVTYYEHNWANGLVPLSLDIELEETKFDSPLLQLMADIVIFVKGQSVSVLCSVISRLIGLKLGSMFVSRYIQALLPIDLDGKPLEPQLKFFESLSQIQFESAVSKGNDFGSCLPSVMDILEVGLIDSIEKFRVLCDVHPHYAVSLWLQGDEIEQDSGFFSKPDASKVILDLIRREPAVLAFHFLDWSAFFDSFPEHEDEIRSLMLIVGNKWQVGFQSASSRTFTIKLPQEVGFLSFLVSALAAADEHRGRPYYDDNRSIQDMMTNYGVDSGMLVSIFKSEAYDDESRAAAFACYIYQADTNGSSVIDGFFKNGMDVQALYFAERKLPSWYISALTNSLRYFDRTKLEVMEFVGKLLYVYRDGYECRFALQKLLGNWRERSGAPVQNNNILSEWLREQV